MFKVFSIVVSYNGLRWYDRCFGSLRNSDTPVQTIVIDNASSDDSAKYIKENFPEVILIESNENLGFAKANNIGIRYAYDHGADFFFLLNQDAWVEKDTISKLLLTFEENESVGIASPIHLNGSYSGMDERFATYLSPSFVSDAYFHRLKPYYKVSFVNAASWLISRECIMTVGGFDTSLFHHYGEDNNFCQRVIYHHFSIVVNTQCTICHDREKRVENGKPLFNAIPFWEERMAFGDINRKVNISKLIRNERRSLIKSYFLFAKKRRIGALKKIEILREIEESREKNQKGGLIWL